MDQINGKVTYNCQTPEQVLGFKQIEAFKKVTQNAFYLSELDTRAALS